MCTASRHAGLLSCLLCFTGVFIPSARGKVGSRRGGGRVRGAHCRGCGRVCVSRRPSFHRGGGVDWSRLRGIVARGPICRLRSFALVGSSCRHGGGFRGQPLSPSSRQARFSVVAIASLSL